MKVARQIRSSDLSLILPSGQSVATSKTQQSTFDTDYADILGADESKNTYSGELVEKNVALQSDLLEIEQLLETTSEVQLEGVRTQHVILDSRNSGSLECLGRFDAEYRFPTSSYFNKEKLIDELELDVQIGALMKNLKIARKIGKLHVHQGRPIGSPTSAAPASCDEPLVSMTPRTNNFDNASSAVSSARSMGSGISILPAEVGASVARMEDLLSELHQKLPSSEVQQIIRDEMTSITQAYFGGRSGTALGNALVQLNAMAYTDVMQFIKTKVNSMNTLFTEKRHTAEAAKVAFEAAAAEQPIDVVRYERTLKEYIDALEDAMKTNADRLNQLMMNTDSEGNFRSTYEATTELIKATVVESRETRTELLKDIKLDSEKLRIEGERRFKEATLASGKYDAWRERSIARIEDCGRRQGKLWEQVEALVEQMGVISKERAALVKEHQSVTEKEYQRKRYYDEFSLAHKNHTNHLNTLKELSSYTLKMLDHVDMYYEHMTTAVEAKNFEEGLHEMKQEDQQAFVELYTAFISQATNLLGRRSARQIIAARTGRVSESLLADPLVPDRANQQKILSECAALVNALTNECEALAVRVERWTPLFDNVMDQLEVVNMDEFTDPQLAWDAKVKEVHRSAVEATTSEGDHLSALQMEVDRLRRKADESEAQFHTLRRNSPPRKKLVKESRARRNLSGRTPRTPQIVGM